VSHEEFSRLPDEALIRLVLLSSWGLIPFSASTLWRRVRSGAFPAPVKVSPQITAWRAGDIRLWLSDPAGFHAERVCAKKGGK
jgi:prophage regulatory protein